MQQPAADTVLGATAAAAIGQEPAVGDVVREATVLPQPIAFLLLPLLWMCSLLWESLPSGTCMCVCVCIGMHVCIRTCT